MDRASEESSSELNKSDKRLVRTIAIVLFSAFVAIAFLNSAQTFLAQSEVGTAEDFRALIRSTSQMSTSSQRVALLVFASLNPPKKELQERLLEETNSELEQLKSSAKELTARRSFKGETLVSNETELQLEKLQGILTQFIQISAKVKDTATATTADIESIGSFADTTSDLLHESRKAVEFLSNDSVENARKSQSLRTEIFFASSFAIVLTAVVVLLFIVKRLGVELVRRRQTESHLLHANEELEHFSSVVAHDLKGPLNNIALSVEMLKRDPVAESRAGNQLLDVVIAETDRLRLMIESLLKLSRIGTKKGEIKTLDVRNLIHEVQANLAPELHECGGKVNYHGMKFVRGDKALLTDLFKNLIENSIQSRNGQPPLIDIKGELTKDTAHFIYDDNSKGIPQEKRKTIFDPFANTSSSASSSTRGLSVAKKIVGAHGGSISLLDKEGPGSRYEFSLARRVKHLPRHVN